MQIKSISSNLKQRGIALYFKKEQHESRVQYKYAIAFDWSFYKHQDPKLYYFGWLPTERHPTHSKHFQIRILFLLFGINYS